MSAVFLRRSGEKTFKKGETNTLSVCLSSPHTAGDNTTVHERADENDTNTQHWESALSWVEWGQAAVLGGLSSPAKRDMCCLADLKRVSCLTHACIPSLHLPALWEIMCTLLKDAVFNSGQRLMIFQLDSQSNYTHPFTCSWSSVLIGWNCLWLSPSYSLCFPLTEPELCTNICLERTHWKGS